MIFSAPFATFMLGGSILSASTSLLARAAEPAARSILLACAVAILLSALRVKSVTPRLAVWKIVLYCALAMPVLGWVLPALPLSVPAPKFIDGSVLRTAEPAPTPGTPTSTAPAIVRHAEIESHAKTSVVPASSSAALDSNLTLPVAEPSRVSSAASAPAHKQVRTESLFSRLKVLAGAVYVAVAAIFFARFLLGFVLSRRLERAARTVDDPRALGSLAFHSRAARLKKLPRLAESEIVLVPVTLGVRRSSILLPAGWRDWDDAELDAVMAHEISHVTRRDALTQRLSLLHRAAFWFSPLSWWLDRRIAELAEEASDEAALAHGADRTRYAETLLNFFTVLESAPGRMHWQGVSMATPGTAERRVDRILAWKGVASSGLKKSLALGFALFAAPVVFFAAAVHPAFQIQTHTVPPAQLQEQAPPPAPPSPYVAPVPSAQPVATAPSAPLPRVTPLPYLPSVAPFAPVAQVAPLPRVTNFGFNYVVQDDDNWRNGQTFAIVSGKKYIYVGRHNFTVSSSSDDSDNDELRWLRRRFSGDFIWLERDGKDYLIRDQATIKRALDLFAPMQALDEKQEELGKQQEALGDQQEALGEKMEQVKVSVPDMTADLDRVSEKIKQLAAGGTQDELGELQSEIGELQSKIGELQSEAGRHQSEVGRQQGELGRKQGEIGRKQGEVGRQQGELSRKAAREMKSVIDDAMAHGLAKPE
jgi:beta-lactamase regulating signal transducer with metallopeptidase domain